MEYKYLCPQCNGEKIYKTENGYKKAITEKKLCRVCVQKAYNLAQNYKKECPICGKEITYKYKSDLTKALKNNTSCKSCCSNSGKFQKEHKLNDIYNNSKNNINKLTEDTLESFYWLGFILADGSFYDNTFELNICKKDLDHLNLFKEFIECGEIIEKPATNSVRLLIHDRHSIKQVIEKYGFNSTKTYNPTDFDRYFKHFSTEQLMSLLIGIIDGDGHIGRNSAITGRCIIITAHECWNEFYTKFFERLNIEVFINKINNTNCIKIGMYKRELILYIYNFILNNNIQHLNRKWNIIKETI